MRILSTLLGLMMSVAACGQALLPEYREGEHYQVLENPVKTITPGKIEVTEAFAYTCGHCFRFEPKIMAWEKTVADDVGFVKLPVVWRESMQVFARIYYTGQALDMEKQVNEAVFDAIHVKRQHVHTESDAVKIFASLGVDKEKFKSAWNSFSVSARVSQADKRTREMQVTGTPQMIVDGRYVVQATPEIGHDGMLEIVDFLIEKIRKEST